MLLQIFRWIYGYVKFIAEGSNIEKFINSTIKKGINLWDMKKEKQKFIGYCIASEYKHIKPIAKNSGVKIEVQKKYGLPFFMLNYQKRFGIVFGVIIFISIIYSLSFYVWEVNVEGNTTVSAEEIKDVMEELGVSPGSLKGHIDVPIVQQSAMLKLPGISWLSLNIEGSNAVVSVKERVVPPDLVPKGNPCNIKASIDGQIDRFETYKGTVAINEGDAVVKGQLLISGVVEDSSGNNLFVHADGKVYAKTKRKYIEDVEMSKVTSTDTGKVKKRHKIKIMGIEIPINIWNNIDETYKVETSKKTLKIGNVELPIVIYTDVCYEQVCDEKIITYEEALEEAIKKIENCEKIEFKDKQILSKNENHFEYNGKCRVEMEYNCIENIGQEEEIIFE